MWDVFISHASEDADAIARPLAIALQTYGFASWLDADALLPHDNLDRGIENGLSQSRVIVLVLSSREDYLVPQIELRLLVFGLKTQISYQCDPQFWRFRRFKDDIGEPLL